MKTHGTPLPRLVLLSGLLAVAPCLTGAPADPIEGSWSGTAESTGAAPAEKATLGIRFEGAADGSFTVLGYFPKAHVSGGPFGTVKPDPQAKGHYSGSGGLTFLVQGDELTGAFWGDARIKLHRSAELPPEDEAPRAPAGPKPLWTYRAQAGFWTRPAIAGGVAYLGSSDGVLHAVALADGRQAWELSTGAPTYAEPTVRDGVVYATNDAGFLVAVEAASGRESWRCDIGGGSVARDLPGASSALWDYRGSSPEYLDGVLYVGSADGGCLAIEARTHATLWRFATAARIRSRPLVTAQRVIFAGFDGFVYALDPRTGALEWKADTKGAIPSDPVAFAETVVVGSRGCRISALRAAGGAPVWSAFQWYSWVESSAVPVGENIYMGSSDLRKVRELDGASGRTAWECDLGGWCWAAPAVAGGRVFIGTAGATVRYPSSSLQPAGSLCAVDRPTGKLLWRSMVAPVAGAYLTGYVGSPAVEGNRVIVGGLDGTLCAYPTGD